MAGQPIESLMKTAMENIREMVNVNTVVGDPVESPDGTVIIPVSRVACGFAAGGGELEPRDNDNNTAPKETPFFGGGSGGGVSVKPVGFLVVGNGQIRLLPVNNNVVADRLIDLVPQLMSQLQSIIDKKKPDNSTPDATVTANPTSGI